MEWIESIKRAIDYIEENIEEDISVEDIANYAYISPFYFQKGFSMLCGYSVGEYIRLRRLARAGIELVSTDIKIIDLAVKYGYDSPDSFTKAFSRFHKVTPTAVRRDGAIIKSFSPLQLIFYLKGGMIMDYKIEKKNAFTVIASEKRFSYENAKKVIPEFWQEHYKSGKGSVVGGMYGINIDETMGCKEFDYLIADDYDGKREVPNGFVVKTIPEFTWAVFPCRGPMPTAMHDVNTKIFSEWLPNCKEYEFAAGYCVEMYEDPRDYKKGTIDESYYSEIWIPVKKK